METAVVTEIRHICKAARRAEGDVVDVELSQIRDHTEGEAQGEGGSNP